MRAGTIQCPFHLWVPQGRTQFVAKRNAKSGSKFGSKHKKELAKLVQIRPGHKGTPPKGCHCISDDPYISAFHIICTHGTLSFPPRRAKASDLRLEAKVGLTESPNVALPWTLETPVAIVFFYCETEFLLEYILRGLAQLLCLLEACIKMWTLRNFDWLGSLTMIDSLTMHHKRGAEIGNGSYLSWPRVTPTTCGVLEVRRRKRGRQAGTEGRGRRWRRAGLKGGELGGSWLGIGHVSIRLRVHLQKAGAEPWNIFLKGEESESEWEWSALNKNTFVGKIFWQEKRKPATAVHWLVSTVSKCWFHCSPKFENGIFEGK